MKVGLTARHNLDEALEKAGSILGTIEDRAEVSVELDTASALGVEGLPLRDMSGLDLLVLIGGDGTILRTLHGLETPVPILGVNMGDVGFLTNAEPQGAEELVVDLLDGFDVERRDRLQASVRGENVPPAMNETVVITSEPAKILNLEVRVDGREAEHVRCDGMIVATPTGSTAYAMSAGGPIVDPRVDASVVVPLAPFKLSARPLVVPGGSKVEVELLRKGKRAKLVVDGQFVRELDEGDVIEFSRAEEPALFVKTWQGEFYSKVRQKLE
ncbi:MAG: NAD kinase [Methanonatronarchaeales archaeon]|nr:NAD kinase [Methanonatronarchaeales archaeon]